MKRCVIFGVSFVLLTLNATGWGAAAADPGIPSDYKVSADPTPQKAEIVGKINAEVARLVNDGDTAGQSAARDWLVTEATLPGAAANNTTPAYIDLYTDALNKAFLPLMTNPQTTVRVRINIAIIAARVADAAKNANLLDTVKATLADKSPAVAQLGEVAAGKILPGVFQAVGGQAAAPDLLHAMVSAVVQHSGHDAISGSIADEAYSALSQTGSNLPPAGFSAVADAVIKLQQARLKLYDTGIPESPDADTPGSLILLSTGNWTNLSTAQQIAAMQNVVDICWSAAQRAQTLPVNQSEELIKTLNHEGILVQSLADQVLHDSNLSAIALQIAKLPIGSKPKSIEDAVSPLYGSVQKSSALFADLKPPKDLPPLAKPGK